MQGMGGFMGAGGLPAPPQPMGPARAGYAGKPPARGPPRNDMYGRPPQPTMPTGYGNPPSMPRPFGNQPQPMMMQGGNQFPPQGPPPQNIPRNMPPMQPEVPMENMEMMPPATAPGSGFGAPIMQPPVNICSEEALYSDH